MSEQNSANPRSDENVKKHLKASLEEMIAAGHDVKEYSEFVLEKFDETYIPYLRQFLADVSRGEIKIKGLTRAAREKLIGRHVSPEERQAMIYEAAYFLAEKRGFAVGHEEEDWATAVRQIDTQLAQEAGLIEKGRKLLESSAENAEEELSSILDKLQDWLRKKQAARKAPSTRKKTVSKKKTVKKAATKDKKEKSEKKKDKDSSTAEKVTGKKTVKKKAAPKKKSVKKKD